MRARAADNRRQSSPIGGGGAVRIRAVTEGERAKLRSSRPSPSTMQAWSPSPDGGGFSRCTPSSVSPFEWRCAAMRRRLERRADTFSREGRREACS
jgi:hypothetical protein